MLNITIQQTTSEKRMFNKIITDKKTLQGVINDDKDFSILDPEIIIEGDIADIKDCNYMYIQEFSRYYWITDIKTRRNNVYVITGHVDPIQTYKEALTGCSGIVKRQQSNFNLYLNDGSLRTYENSNIQTYLYSTGLTTDSIVLTVAGD